MKLIDPQPMETLPKKGEVFVEYEGKVDVFSVLWIRWINGICTAWSYTATTKGGEDEK